MTTAPRRTLPALLFLLTLTVACTSDGGWHEVNPESISAIQTAQLQRAEAARDTLGSTLLGELTVALGNGGAAAAIDVCAERAPVIAADVAKHDNVRIGRTSLQLRNKDNQPPEWARAHVVANTAEPAMFAGPTQQLGALFPIRLMPQCAQCHGTPEQLSAEVEKALGERYPQDRARGYAPGDLRGWFWVEVPAPN